MVGVPLIGIASVIGRFSPPRVGFDSVLHGALGFSMLSPIPVVRWLWLRRGR